MFYTTLLEKCKRAKKRITFASLYLGTGPLETELVGIIKADKFIMEKFLQLSIGIKKYVIINYKDYRKKD